MVTKQRVSLLVALLLPAIALSAYLFLAPAKAGALSCPGGTFKSLCPQTGKSTWCGTGTGSCVPPGGGGTFIFCPTSNGQHPGPGICESNNLVCCTQ
jgi:hypothetical protein